ncbi:MAG TPA: alpha/beta hydrolase [Micromonosporaceae bacterium]
MDATDSLVAVAPGVRLHVRRWAGGRPPAFLLVHGLSSNARLWDEVAARIARAGHAAYAVDLRSHGESDQPAEGYDTATAAADLAALAGALGLGKVIVAGQSWGGNVAVRLAAEQPELVAGLGLVDGGWIDLTADFGSWEECAAALRPPDLDGTRVSQIRGWLWRAHPDWSATAIEATVANLRVAPDGTLTRRLPIPQHMRIVRSMWDDPPGRYLSAVAAPTLLLPAIPRNDPRRAERARSRVVAAAAVLPAATIREYADSDHDLHAQHPDRVAADLLSLADGPS